MLELITRDANGEHALYILSTKWLQDFLDICFRHADCFTLNEAPWAMAIRKDLQLSLSPFLIQEVKTPKWFGYDYTSEPNTKWSTHAFIYRAESAAKEILLQHMPNVFFREKDVDTPFPTLEDLCFFSDGRLFIGNVSHARMLWAYPPNEEVELQLKQIADWSYVDRPTPNLEEYLRWKSI
mgnify:CR=1 FL=1